MSGAKQSVELAESLGPEPLVDVGSDAPRRVRHPITSSDTRYTAPPLLGEHNREIRLWLKETTR